MDRNFDLDHEVTQVLDPAVITEDTNCASVDKTGYDFVTFLALIGESGDTLAADLCIELEVEDSPDDSDFTDVDDAYLSTVVVGSSENDGTFAEINAAAEDDAVYKTTYRGSAKYVRPVVNVTGTHTNGTPIGIVAILHGQHGDNC